MNATALLALQDIDSALDAIAHKRPRLAEVVAHEQATAALAALQAQMATAQQRIDNAQVVIDEAEQAGANLTSKRARLESQLKTIIAPREAEALMHQIATLNGQRSELDDQELAALDEQAAGEETLATLGVALPEHDAAVATAKVALDEALAALDSEATALREQRATTVAQLMAEELTMYDHVRKQFAGVGVARLEHNHCSGCHMDLSPRELDIVKAVPAGDIAECPQCGRIIVR